MTQQPTSARRKGSVGGRDVAPSTASSTSASVAVSGRALTPSRQVRASTATTTTSNTTAASHATSAKPLSAARASSAPKQRGKSTSAPPPPPSRHDAALAKMTATAAGQREDELQLLLQQLLRRAQFTDAAYLIAASPALAAKFKTSDVVRLMLDAKQFEPTAQLIRDMQLQTNQLLVTLFVKELVRSTQFHAAVRYAQEFVQNFGKKDFGPRDHARPSWTPQALVQAMVRARHLKTALKFAKQFELLDTFPPRPLVAGMLEARQFDDAVASVMEFRLFADFPIDALIATLLRERQWSLAAKCMGKVTAKPALDACADALVRAAAQAGDFVTSLRYLREFKLDDVATHRALLEDVVRTMALYSEMYKAIKYAIKFGLQDNDSDDNSTGPFATRTLVRQAIEVGQVHVASLYIKKLRLKDAFAHELAEIAHKQTTQLHEFREFVGFRDAQVSHPASQQALAALLGDLAETDADFVALEAASTEIVLTESEEIVPRRRREAAPAEMRRSSDDDASRVAASSDPGRLDSERQSRFSFARASASTESGVGAQLQPSPPGLALFATVAPAEPSTSPSTSSFDFAQFASAVQSHTPPVMNQLPPSLGGPPGMYASMAPIHHFGREPMPPPPPPASLLYAPMYPQDTRSGGFLPTMHAGQAPSPPSFLPPPSALQNLSTGGFSGMDISSLAMQFHSGGGGGPPAFGSMNHSGAMRFAPQLHPHAPPAASAPLSTPAALPQQQLFPASFAPPLPPPQFAPPPRSSFKPSIGYTSVTTTRQKK